MALEGCDDVVDLILQELGAAYKQSTEEEANDHAFFRLPVVGGEEMNEIIFICGFSINREQWVIILSMDDGVEEGE